MATDCHRGAGQAEYCKDDVSTEEEVRVVLLGKTGTGKSSLGNTLLGQDVFHVSGGMCSGTDRCQFAHTSSRPPGTALQVTDTPGVCDTHRSEEEVLKEVGKSLVVASPGPHVILMVMRCDRRFTQEEYDAYMTLKCLFGEDICHHMIVVFVGLDCLGATVVERDARLQQEVENSPPLLRHVIDDARGRYYGVDNMAPQADREAYARGLLGMIQNLVTAKGGSYFSSQLHDDVNAYVQTCVMQRMQAENVTFDEAMTSTKLDVIKEKTSPDFFQKLVDIVGNRILPILRKVLGVAIAMGATAVSTYCSVM